MKSKFSVNAAYRGHLFGYVALDVHEGNGRIGRRHTGQDDENSVSW